MTNVCSDEFYVCPVDARFRETCAPGTYILTTDTPADANSCNPCDAGYFCEGPGTRTPCRAGYVSIGNNNQ